MGDSYQRSPAPGESQTYRVPLTVEITEQAEAYLVAIGGELDLATVATLERELQPLAGRRVILDLRSLDFMDSSGISLLLRLSRANPGSITIERTSPAVERLLRAIGLDSHFRPDDDRSPAWTGAAGA
jgi:anti-anti-sigma factor